MKRLLLGLGVLALAGVGAQAATTATPSGAKPLPKFYVDAHVFNKQDLPIQVTLDALVFRPLKKGEQAWFREEASSGTHSIRIIGPDKKTTKVYVGLSYGREVPGMGPIYAYCVDITKYDAAAAQPWTVEVETPDKCKPKVPAPK